jgi:hypothetical protein
MVSKTRIPPVAFRHLSVITAFSLMTLGVAGQDPITNPTPPVTQEHNFARGFSGARALVQEGPRGGYIPNATLNSIIDDDVASGWTPPVGKTRVLLQLSQLADLKSLTLYAPGAEGSYSVYIANTLEEVEDEDLKLVSEDVDLESGEQTKLPNTPALYVVLEFNVVGSAPIRNIMMSGVPSTGAIATTTVVSPASGSDSESVDQEGEVVEVNFALKSLGGELTKSESALASDNLIDGDTSTATTLGPDENGKIGTTVRLASAVDVDRITLAIGDATGQITVYSSAEDGTTGRALFTAQVDGSTGTLSFDVGGIPAEFIRLDWQPDEPGTPLVVKEVGIFALARVQQVAVAPGQSGKIVLNSMTSSSPPTTVQIPLDSGAALGSSPQLPTSTPIEPRPVSG